MTVTDASVTWLTQEAYDRLKAELEAVSYTPLTLPTTERV